MQYTNLGRTGLSVSQLCLGTMNFGPETSEEDSHAVMDYAHEVGINFFDSANVYGGRSLVGGEAGGGGETDVGDGGGGGWAVGGWGRWVGGYEFLILY